MDDFKSDEALLEKIKTGDKTVIDQSYKMYKEPFISYVIHQFSIGRRDALECYVEAFTDFYFNIRRGRIQPPLKSRLRTYLFSIGKYTWLNKRKARSKILSMQDTKMREERFGEESQFDAADRAKLVQSLLKQLEESCRSVLTMFFLKGYSAEAVAMEMGLTNEATARKRKFDCLKKMRKLIPRHGNSIQN